MSSHLKNYFRFTFDEVTEYALNIDQLFEGTTICETVSHGLKQTKQPAVKNIHRIPTEILSQLY